MSRRPAPLVLLVAAATAAGAGGCLYLPGINARPDAAIEKLTTGVVFVDPLNPVRLSAAESDDPDGTLSLTAYWRATVCEDEAGTICPPTSDDQLQEGDIWEEFAIIVDERKPILVTLTVEDSRGARDSTDLMIDVGNREPEMMPQKQGFEWGDGFPLGTWIDVVANGSDEDGDEVNYTFEVFAPTASTPESSDCPDIEDCLRLVPDVVGVYEVRITADDGAGGVHDEVVPIEVIADAAPCAVGIDPAAAGVFPVDRDGGPWVANAQILDDLDPSTPQDSEYFVPIGPTYAWQVASPDTGGELLPVEGLNGGEYLLDPSVYAPGDRISIRLEIADRIARTLPCDASEASCSIDDDPECVQRVTWEVEIQ